MTARTAWYEDTLLPKITNMFWKGVAATIAACLSGLFFIVSALIDRHTLEIEREFSKQFVSVEEHQKDIEHLSQEFEKLGNEMNHSMSAIIDRLDRNLGEIQKVKK